MADHSRGRPGAAAFDDFVSHELGALLSRHTQLDLSAHVLGWFREAVRDVPAYARFLAERGVDPANVRTLTDFAGLPVTSKAEYHKAFPLSELCRGGALERADFVAVSSGSTGEPTLWPRFFGDELGTSTRFEQVLRAGFGLESKRTLGVVCFALGSWVGGMYTTFACRNLSAKGYPLTLVTPGNNRVEILRVVRALAPSFDEVVLFGYPPFLKDVIDAGRADGLDWSRLRVHLVTAGEVFSEEWRSLVLERLGAREPRQIASLYGTADGGVLANETPLSVEIRRFLAEKPAAARELFGESRLPTLCQYDPYHRYFEAHGEEVVFSADGTIPLMRYRILDRGSVVPYSRMIAFLRDHGFSPASNGAEIAAELPFVSVFGRSGFALSFYGANVYPENVSVGLEQPEIAGAVTGKFVMELRETAERDSELSVTVELAAGVEASAELAARVARSVKVHLERLNSEFFNYAPAERRTPRITLLPLGDPEYFPANVKHRYTRH
jgi:phenylacetate-CoA ligase